jgi:hypothetical protein
MEMHPKVMKAMKANRRQQERKDLDTLAFFQLDGDDGGKILNISEGGLCFESFAAVPQNKLFHFWFSLDLRSRIEATGKLAWMDATKRVGGLSFVEMGRKTRERIRAWIMQTGIEERPSVEQVYAAIPAFGALGEQSREPAPIAKKKPRWHLRPVGGTPLPLANPNNFEKIALPVAEIPQATVIPQTPVISQAGANPQTADGLQLVPAERYRSATRGQFIRGIILGILISSAVGVPIFKYSRGEKQSGAVTARSGPGTQGNSSVEETSLAAISPAKTARDPLAASTTGKSMGSKPVSYVPDNPAVAVPGRERLPSQEATSLATGSRVAQSSPQMSSQEPKRARKNSATPQQLWSSVQAGNTKAAVALADLYIRGEGVPVNCDQARILLLVASEKNNAEAIKKLRDLDKTGCPPGTQ